MTNEILSNICMNMIANVGEGRGYIYEALEKLLSKDYIDANDKLIKADEYLSEAHRIQFEELMSPQARGEELPFSLLLIHAMDLLMISMSERDLIRKVVESKLKESK